MTDPTKVNADSLDGGDSIQTTLGELWELLDKGTHEAWPECVEPLPPDIHATTGNGWAYFIPDNVTHVHITDAHALAIARDHIEGWLVEMGFEIGIEPGSRNYYWYDGSSGEWICTLASEALTEAVRYALNREMNKEANSHKPPYK